MRWASPFFTYLFCKVKGYFAVAINFYIFWHMSWGWLWGWPLACGDFPCQCAQFFKYAFFQRPFAVGWPDKVETALNFFQFFNGSKICWQVSAAVEHINRCTAHCVSCENKSFFSFQQSNTARCVPRNKHNFKTESADIYCFAFPQRYCIWLFSVSHFVI